MSNGRCGHIGHSWISLPMHEPGEGTQLGDESHGLMLDPWYERLWTCPWNSIFRAYSQGLAVDSFRLDVVRFIQAFNMGRADGRRSILRCDAQICGVDVQSS